MRTVPRDGGDQASLLRSTAGSTSGIVLVAPVGVAEPEVVCSVCLGTDAAVLGGMMLCDNWATCHGAKHACQQQGVQQPRQKGYTHASLRKARLAPATCNRHVWFGLVICDS